MSIRKQPLENGEHYHIYNRGVEKRTIVQDKKDIVRFLRSLKEFNTTTSTGGIYQNSFTKLQLRNPVSKLVNIVAFNVLDNHYHLILEQLTDSGISRFMKSVGGGYTKYFNKKYNRVGPLFQGAFKSSHIDTNEKLLKLSAYVNLNHVIHGYASLRNPVSKWEWRSSWEQYVTKVSLVNLKNAGVAVSPQIVLDQFPNHAGYKKEAKEIAQFIIDERADGLEEI